MIYCNAYFLYLMIANGSDEEKKDQFLGGSMASSGGSLLVSWFNFVVMLGLLYWEWNSILFSLVSELNYNVRESNHVIFQIWLWYWLVSLSGMQRIDWTESCALPIWDHQPMLSTGLYTIYKGLLNAGLILRPRDLWYV